MIPLPPLAGRLFLRCVVILCLNCAAALLHAAIAVAIGQNFTGSTYGIDSPYLPPDCNGAAGPDQYVELINGRFTIYAKSDGSAVQTMTSADFWNQTGLMFDPGVIVTDPRILYDPSVQRWFACAIELRQSDEVSNRFVLAVSATVDPTGSWKGLAFTADPVDGNFADFPTLGLDANGVYLAGFLFRPNTELDLGQTLVSIPKADLLGATPIAANRTWFGLLESTNYGYILQSAVSFDTSAGTCTVLAVGNLGYDWVSHSNLLSFAVQNAAGPGPATLSLPTNINVERYYKPLNPTQPDGNDTLDVGDTRFSAKVYQVGGILYGVHSCEISNRAALRWYKINAATHEVLQWGTIADTNLEFFYPSIAANLSGTAVIGFNGCSTSTFVSSYAVVGETVDGITTFGAPLLLKSGSASYKLAGFGNVSRWGDYSSTCVDPADPNRFWTIQMYPIYSGVWATQITELLTAVPMLDVAHSGPNNLVISWPTAASAFNLESAAVPDAPNWSLVDTSAAISTNGRICLSISTTNSIQFFRLHKP